jgi:uncharacterized membrane protein
MSSSDRLVSDYLDKLEAELAGIPRDGRREVLDEIEAHIHESLAELDPDDEVGVRNVLARLGEPAEIAADARERFGVKRVQTTWREIGALILLPFGGFILPAFGWFAGVVLLWVSDAWNTRDKVIGTLVLPGGFAVPFFLLVFVGGGSGSNGGGCVIPFGGPTTCTGGGTAVWRIVQIALFALLLLAPLVVDGYLIWRLRKRTA